MLDYGSYSSQIMQSEKYQNAGYDNYAETFSNSRKELHWGELDTIIEDIRLSGYKSILDVGCGNGRLLERTKTLGLKIQRYHGTDSSSGMIKEAKKLHKTHDFTVFPMEILRNCGPIIGQEFDAIVLLASFHHLETLEDRLQFLTNIQAFLAPGGAIYMTNWNLRDQPRYQKSHRGDGDYDIKIGEYSRYYHGFMTEELAELFHETGYRIIENRVFEGGRNIWSKLQLD